MWFHANMFCSVVVNHCGFMHLIPHNHQICTTSIFLHSKHSVGLYKPNSLRKSVSQKWQCRLKNPVDITLCVCMCIYVHVAIMGLWRGHLAVDS